MFGSIIECLDPIIECFECLCQMAQIIEFLMIYWMFVPNYTKLSIFAPNYGIFWMFEWFLMIFNDFIKYFEHFDQIIDFY